MRIITFSELCESFSQSINPEAGLVNTKLEVGIRSAEGLGVLG